MKKKIKKEIEENAIAEDEENAVIFFLEELKAIFRNRIEQYNRDNEDYKDYVSLTIKNSVIKKMYWTLKFKEKTDIKNAFLAFSDDMLYMRVKPKLDALSYFLKEEKGEFPVIDTYKLHFIINYSTK